MKAQTRMIVASAVVIAFALTAVSGITYSWFSDTEEATISVSTAKMEYVTTWEESYKTDVGTEVTITAGETGKATVAVNNLVPGANLPIIESIVNKSTIKTVYRITAVPELAENHTYTTYDLSNILICGKALDFSYNDGVITLNETVIENWTLLAVGKNPATQSVYITTPQSYGGDGINSIVAYNPSDGTGSTEKTGAYTEDWSPEGKTGLTIKFTVTAVQGDFPYTEMKTDGETKVVSANIPENKVVKAKTITVSSAGVDDPATVSDVIVDFSNVSTYNTGGETTQEESIEEKSVSVEVKSVDSAGKIEVDLNLKSGETVVESPKFNEPVVVTMTVPGEFTNPVIIYDGKEDGKIISSIIKDGSTTITFSVNHFSEYTIQNITDVHDAATLKNTLEKGIYARLTADISGVSDTITMKSTDKVVLYLNGHTIDFTANEGFKYTSLEVDGTVSGSKITATADNEGIIFQGMVSSNLRINGGEYVAKKVVVSIGSGASAVIDDGTFSTTGDYEDGGHVCGCNFGGNITINGGTFSAVGEKEFIVNSMVGNITINDGEFNASGGCKAIIYDPWGSTIIINNGEFLFDKPTGTSDVKLISSSKECTINGGEFTMVTDENDTELRKLLHTSTSGAGFTVTGGTFKIVNNGSNAAYLFNIGGNTEETPPEVSVTGGVFEIVNNGSGNAAFFNTFPGDVLSVSGGTFTITKGTDSTGNIKIAATNNAEFKDTDKKFISGGTFNLDPANYLKDSSVTKDESGKWVVTASSTQQ